MSPEELAQAAFEPNQFALRWVQAVVDDRAEMVWPQMTPDFRLSLAQWWLIHNPEALNDPSATSLDRDELVRLLAAEKPEHILFRHLARVSLRELRNGFGGLDVSQLGPGTRPRPIGPDLELVRLFCLPDLDKDDAGNYVFAAGTAARTVSVLVERREQGWAVAGVGESLLRPGWPPTYERVVQIGD